MANFGSPYWGAPKAWFAVAYGYETPLHEISDDIVANAKSSATWTRNLTGLYYLIPPQAWFDHVPGRASTWLEVNDWAMPDAKGAARAFGDAGGNEEARAGRRRRAQASTSTGSRPTTGDRLAHLRGLRAADDGPRAGVTATGVRPAVLVGQR